MQSTLFLITARGGSKGIPGKNVKPLDGRPLVTLAVDVARAVADPAAGDAVCLSTDDDAIAAAAEAHGLAVPFRRPAELASDTAGSYEVLLHALDWYGARGEQFDRLVLLQPTSPFRQPEHVRGALAVYAGGAADGRPYELVVSVKVTEANPYYVLREEDEAGFLVPSKPATFARRQDAPTVYEYNGAVYVIDVAALRARPLHQLRRVGRFVMDRVTSTDLDTPLDWAWAEFLLGHGMASLPPLTAAPATGAALSR